MDIDLKKKSISSYFLLSFIFIPIFTTFLLMLTPITANMGETLFCFLSPVVLTIGFTYYVYSQKIFEDKNLFYLFILSLYMAVSIRMCLLPYASSDYTYFLKPWLASMQENTTKDALTQPITNYNLLYNYILYIISLIPLSDLFLIKFFSIFFDCILASTILVILKKCFNLTELFAFLGFILALLIPSFCLNSAAWGQCDSIYVALSLIALYLCLDKRPTLGCVFFGLAISMKLQALMLFPILIFLLAYKQIHIRHLLWIPIVYCLISLPAIIMGKPIKEALLIYFQQIKTYPALSNGAPSFWALFPNTQYEYIMPAALCVAGTGLLIFTFMALLYRNLWNKKDFFELAFIFALLIPYILPKMHDRYFFLATALSIIYLFIKPKNWLCVFGIIMTDLFIYEPFLLGHSVIDTKYLSILNLLILIFVLKSFFTTILLSESESQLIPLSLKIKSSLKINLFSKITNHIIRKWYVLFFVEIVILSFFLCKKIPQTIFVEHPAWRERLLILDENHLIRPSVQEKATIKKNSDSELIIEWEYAGEEKFIKENNIFKFQK